MLSPPIYYRFRISTSQISGFGQFLNVSSVGGIWLSGEIQQRINRKRPTGWEFEASQSRNEGSMTAPPSQDTKNCICFSWQCPTMWLLKVLPNRIVDVGSMKSNPTDVTQKPQGIRNHFETASVISSAFSSSSCIWWLPWRRSKHQNNLLWLTVHSGGIVGSLG